MNLKKYIKQVIIYSIYPLIQNIFEEHIFIEVPYPPMLHL